MYIPEIRYGRSISFEDLGEANFLDSTEDGSSIHFKSIPKRKNGQACTSLRSTDEVFGVLKKDALIGPKDNPLEDISNKNSPNFV